MNNRTFDFTKSKTYVQLYMPQGLCPHMSAHPTILIPISLSFLLLAYKINAALMIFQVLLKFDEGPFFRPLCESWYFLL